MADEGDQLPLYLGRRASSTPPLGDDPRQSFPATVRERDSFASTWTQNKRESIVRGPPPPLPPKPPKKDSWSSVLHPPESSSLVATSEATPVAGSQPEPTQRGGQDDSPDPQGSPSQWLDVMFGYSEPRQSSPALSRTPSTSHSGPFPNAPRIPPRPPPHADVPAAKARTPPPAIQFTPTASPPTGPPLPARTSADASSARPSPSRQPPPSTSSTTTSSTSSSSPLSSSPSASTSAMNATSALNTIGAGIQHLKLKDRLAAGVGFGREWGGKGKEKLQEGWRAGSAAVGKASGGSAEKLGSSPTEDSTFAAGHARARSTSPLPASILGHRLPKNPPRLAFGLPLPEVVQSTRVQDPGGALHRKKDDDPVTGDEARRWLPSVAYRSLQYLEEWGKTEEGIYRVPGRSNLVSQLRALFDAGIDPDLRETHPGDLDPHAVASLFKSWLREIPDSLLSPELEPTIETLTTETLGYTASAGQFLGQKPAAPAGGGMVHGRAPRAYLEQLRELFAGRMAAEYFYLLRALAYHLARLASHAGTNKMTLSNLRLILSPTLRLSPVFLQILVEEREILFGKTNESARTRETADTASPHSPNFASGHSSPSLSHYGNHPSSTGDSFSSARQSPLFGAASQHFDADPTPPSSNNSSSRLPRRGSDVDEQRNGMGAGWMAPDEPSSYESLAGPSERRPSSPSFPQTPSLYNNSNPASPAPTRTPIADRFVATFAPPMATSASRTSNGSGSSFSHSVDSPPPSAGLSPLTVQFPSQTSPKLGGGPPPPPKPFIPSRQTTAEAAASSGSFFGNRSPVLGASNGTTSRKGSVTSLGGGSTHSAPTSSAMASRSASDSSIGSIRTPVAATVAGQGRRGAVDGGEATSARRELQGLGLSGDGEQERLVETVVVGETRRGSVDRLMQARRQWSDDTDSTAGSMGQRKSARSSSFGESSGRPSLESITRASVNSGRSFSSSSSQTSTAASKGPAALPSLDLPAGLGLGLEAKNGHGEKQEEEEGGWGLLSMEERKRFFSG